MPRPVSYKSQSIIYFEGDVSNKIFVLKEGRVAMNYRDIETGKELQEIIQKGEFFGVKSALGRYAREESVTAISDCILLVFTVQEFEDFASQNTRVIMKMLKVFSNQLRRMHTKVRSLLSLDAQMNPETGLIRTAQYFQNRNRHAQALYAYSRYLELYPQGKFVAEATEGKEGSQRRASHQAAADASAAKKEAQEAVAKADDPGQQAAEEKSQTGSSFKGQASEEASDAYYDALSHFGNQEYDKALAIFTTVAKDPGGGMLSGNSMIEIGRCLFYLKRYKEAVQHLSQLAQQHPDLPDITIGIYYIGNAYRELGNTDKAKAFYERILSMPNVEADLKKKVSTSLRRMEGKS